ncbi:MAG: preprotein translocase subunit SecG [Candidatus Levybacteria bacterium RIFCSPHIGHO2_12_FULL_38_12]|nr:MAG: preprotein translocase subunit SecG [Candidatus Levybacteria bacterium RIFCSPHIGHO2_01_FULL_38_12]OGH22274.1 MAG: preprotein translocase subunit SecG [Candidatus Levybacteria bacterium RIFCSPHIGHO2_02_FULL_37_18]OGH23362.1 MAG: preprotein translocase subunit SecG [Candidatus Levybacteria bacterium RIFCSPHIGHO2_12_FULL_38_12]OGH34537.1 MAG: preprotein translocase subunit SecG [Candidatus Levybacteria bacterium RIFCSPLOWO2_01_FULL_37_20]OGH43418.1 MAG: preprotein translocase subunit SecG 
MILISVQIIVSILLILTVLLQMQGSGLSTTFGGGGEFFRSKRSIEKILYFLTIILAALFGILSLVLLIPPGR